MHDRHHADMARNPSSQRPRGSHRRRFRTSVQLDRGELLVLRAEAEREGLALGAYIRAMAVLGALDARQRREN